MGAAERKEELDIPMKALFGVITDYASYPQFVTGMKATTVEMDGGNKKVRFDLEMIKRLRYQVSMQEEINEEAGTAKVEWTLIEGDMLKKNSGCWQLRSLGPDRTEVIYSLEVEFNFRVPGFILKGLISNSLPTAIREFSDRAKKVSGD